jgi:DNA-binding SARP family transcriptional activator/TolB-like protein/Tfp pilus assembly protein PilF
MAPSPMACMMERSWRSTASRTASGFTHVGCARQDERDRQVEFNIINSSSGNELRVTTFGRLTIVGDGEEVAALARQRRKLAVLVVLALSGRARTRDSLTEMFWGDQDEERARHSLSEALSHVRRVLGRDAIATRLTEISLAPNAPLSFDATDFERHVRAGELARAIEVYTGPFLDGVHIEGSSTFEQWVDERRAHFERLYVKAAGQHCQALARARQWDECGRVAERWLALTPLSADAALYLLNARKANGSREALQRAAADYEQLKTRLRREYESEPDAVVSDLARGIVSELARIRPSIAVESSAAVESSPAAESSVSTGPRTAFSRRWRVRIAAVAAVLFVVGIVTVARAWGSRRASGTGAPARIAVMPFTHIGADSATAYFTAGMTEEVAAALGTVDGLRVLPVSAVAPGANGVADLRALGQRLGADAVLAGSIRADGDSARIVARLISTKDGYQLWAGHFERLTGSASGVQEEIANAIAATLRRQFSSTVGRVAKRAVVDPATYDLYLRGRYFENRSGEPNLRRAMDYYQRALERDSTFAPAYAGLANAQVTLFGWGHSYAETVPLARAYADRALAIDPSLGAAHYVLGRLHWYDWRWADSEREYLLAIAANPSDVQTHHMLSHTYLATGQLAQSLVESRKALELEPLNPRIGLHLCVHFMFARQWDDALAACERGIELDSTFPDAHAKLGEVYFYKGLYNPARTEMEREMAIAGRIPLYVTQRAMIEAAAGNDSAARVLLAEVRAKESPARLPLFYIAATYAQMGELDSAMSRLDEAYSNHSPDLDGLALDAAFDPLRGDARFKALLRKLGETTGGRR